MPIDIELLRGQTSGEVPESLARVLESEKRRFRDGSLVQEVVALDKQWVSAQFDTEQLRKEANAVQKQITERKKASKGQDKCEDLVAQKTEIEQRIAAQATKSDELLEQRDAKLHYVGNLVHDTVPVSQDEDLDNEVVATFGEDQRFMIPAGSFRTDGFRPHYQLLEMLGAVELEAGVEVAGHRGYFLSGVGVLLNQALINYGLAFLYGRQYTPIQPPYFMKKDMMGKTAELKDYNESLYCIVEDRDDPSQDKFMIATSEQPISALHYKSVLEDKDLPKKYAGISTCFRKEAGSSGRDIKGIFRIHQFEKVEQFAITTPEEGKSWEMMQNMIDTAQDFYKSLGLPYRVVNIVSGELNDAAAKKFDLEAWFPGDDDGKGKWRELVSTSNCLDYQARAMSTKFKHPKKGEKQQFVHMLNGTLCATERAMCCLVENYQTPEGVKVPEVLKPFMCGLEFLPFVRPVPKDRV